MTSRLLAAIITTLPGTALAHTGHMAESGGHTHWLAFAILGGFGVALAAWGLYRALRSSKEQRQA